MALAAACQGGAASPAVQALVVEASDAGRAELRQVVSSALGQPVLLAADALTQSSELFIERTPRSGPHGVRIPGRDTEPAQRFRLLATGGKCVLLHLDTDTHYELRRVRCRPPEQRESRS